MNEHESSEIKSDPRSDLKSLIEEIDSEVAIKQDVAEKWLQDQSQKDPVLYDKFLDAWGDGLPEDDYGDRLQEVSPALRPLFISWHGFNKEIHNLSVKKERLLSQVEAYQTKEYVDILDSLSKNINYEKVFEFFHNRSHVELPEGEDEYGSRKMSLSGVLSDLQLVYLYKQESDNGMYSGKPRHLKMESIEKIKFIQKSWGENGFLQGINSKTTDSSNVESTDSKTLDEMLSLLSDAKSNLDKIYVYRYSKDIELESVYSFLSQSTEDIEKNIELYDIRGVTPRLNPDLIKNISHYVSLLIEENRQAGYLPSNGEGKGRSIMPHAVIEQNGWAPKNGYEMCVTPELVLNDLNENIPSAFTSAISEISAYERSSVLKSDPAGVSIPVYDARGRLVGSKIELYRNWRVREGSSVGTRQKERELALIVATHEVGHGVHYGITYEEMLEWESVVQNDPIAVTDYIETSRNKDKSIGKREDWADTFALFVKKPALLQVLSSGRYEFMCKYFDKYSTPMERSRLNTKREYLLSRQREEWIEQGISDEDIRNEYLGENKRFYVYGYQIGDPLKGGEY